jgi:hypothetical protein
MGSLTKAHAFLNKVQAPAPPLDMPMLIKTFASAQDVADIRAQVEELGQAFDDNLMDQTPIESILLETVPPATGDNPGI